MNLISDELNAALCEQLGHEKYNSNLYLYIAGYLKNKGFDNLAKKFEDQHEEEFEHSKMIYGILTDLNSPVSIPEIEEINISLGSILDVAKSYLDREVLTTESLNSIKKMTIDEDNSVVEEFIREMIKLQRHEYAEATTFMDKAEIIGNDWRTVLLWDASLK